jgi:hypothetical protein
LNNCEGKKSGAKSITKELHIINWEKSCARVKIFSISAADLLEAGESDGTGPDAVGLQELTVFAEE